MRKLFGFLGVRDVRKDNILYKYTDDTSETFYPLTASAQKYNVDAVYPIFSEKAFLVNAQGLQEAFDNLNIGDKLIMPDTYLDNIDKIEGMWSVFSYINDNIQEDDILVFDVTNGFRSLPIIAIAAINFIKQKYNNVVVEDVVYGQIPEGIRRNEDGSVKHVNEGCSMESLIELLELDDWAMALRSYEKTGDLTDMSLLVNRRAHKDTAGIELVKTLDQFDKSLKVLRIDELPERKEKVLNAIIEFKQSKNKAKYSNLINTFIDNIDNKYKNFNKDNWIATIQWHLERENIQQAITVSTELFPSLISQRKLFQFKNANKDNFNELAAIKDALISITHGKYLSFNENEVISHNSDILKARWDLSKYVLDNLNVTKLHTSNRDVQLLIIKAFKDLINKPELIKNEYEVDVLMILHKILFVDILYPCFNDLKEGSTVKKVFPNLKKKQLDNLVNNGYKNDRRITELNLSKQEDEELDYFIKISKYAIEELNINFKYANKSSDSASIVGNISKEIVSFSMHSCVVLNFEPTTLVMENTEYLIDLADTYQKLKKYRNDINHSGTKESAKLYNVEKVSHLLTLDDFYGEKINKLIWHAISLVEVL